MPSIKKVNPFLSYLFLVVKSFNTQSSGIPFLFPSGALSSFPAYRRSEAHTFGFFARVSLRDCLDCTPPPHGSRAAYRIHRSVSIGNKHANDWKNLLPSNKLLASSNIPTSRNKYDRMGENPCRVPVPLLEAGPDQTRKCCGKNTDRAPTMAFLQLYRHGVRTWTRGESRSIKGFHLPSLQAPLHSPALTSSWETEGDPDLVFGECGKSGIIAYLYGRG